MQSIINLFKREIQIIAKDHTLLLTLLIAPIFYAFFYGSIYSNKTEKDVKIAIVDHDQSRMTHAIVKQIDLLPTADAVTYVDLQEAQEALNKGDVQGILLIEKGLEKNVLALKPANMVLSLNASRFLPSSDLTSAITKVTLTTSAAIRMNYFKKNGKSSELALLEANPIHFNYKSLYNETVNYGDFLLPGLLALILQQTLLIGLSESMAGERENKTFGSLYAVANQSTYDLIIGKGSFYLLLYSIYSFFFFTVNYHVLNLSFRGSVWDLSLLLLLFFCALIPLGMFIGSFFKQQLLVMQIMAFSTYPIFLISGYSMPFQALPVSVQYLAKIVPTTPFLRAYISITQTGGTFAENSGAFIHLALLGIVFTLLLSRRLKRLARK